MAKKAKKKPQKKSAKRSAVKAKVKRSGVAAKRVAKRAAKKAKKSAKQVKPRRGGTVTSASVGVAETQSPFHSLEAALAFVREHAPEKLAPTAQPAPQRGHGVADSPLTQAADEPAPAADQAPADALGGPPGVPPAHVIDAQAQRTEKPTASAAQPSTSVPRSPAPVTRSTPGR